MAFQGANLRAGALTSVSVDAHRTESAVVKDSVGYPIANGEYLRAATERTGMAVDKKWKETADVMTAADFPYLDMQPYGDFLWGRCTACSVWLDKKHLASDKHKKRVGTCQPCVDTGLTTSSVNESPCDSGSSPQVPATFVQTASDSRKFQEYVPRGYEREQCSVAFVVDSLHYFVWKSLRYFFTKI